MHQFSDSQFDEAVQHNFQPFENNGGTTVAISGDNFAIIGGCTRLCEKMRILSRNHRTLHALTSKVVMGTSGNSCDCGSLGVLLESRVKQYADDHDDREISLTAISQMCSNVMYAKRLFPYYASLVLAGVHKGKGYVYSFDPIGHVNSHSHLASGTAGSFFTPILDNQIAMSNLEQKSDIPLTLDRAIDLIVDVFRSVTERNVLTGDGVILAIITEDGIESLYVPLSKD